jgi:hypothetical protein
MSCKKFVTILFLLSLTFLLACPHPPPPPPPPPVVTVTVDVCASSLLLPNKWCPEIIARIYQKGQEPTTVCDLHKEPPPPPIVLSKCLFVSAYDLFTATGDKEKFIKAVAETGATGFRIFYQYSWNGNIASPYPKVATWKAGYADAPDLAFYDQGDATWAGAKWDSAYWDEFIRIHILIKKYGMEVYGVIHDNCSFKMAGWQKYEYPFLSSSPDRAFNDPEYNKYPGGFWAMREDQGGRETVQILHELYIIKIVNTLNDIGVKYRLEFINEDSIQGWDDTYVGKYYKWLQGFFASRGVAKDRLIACGREAGIPYIGLYSIHGIVRPDKIPNSPHPHEMILISGDGGFDGNGAADARGRKGLGVNDAESFAQKILDMGYAGAEVLCRKLYLGNNDRMNADDWDAEVVRRMVLVLKK